MSPKQIGVGLIGLGNVGQGVVKILDTHARVIEARLGAPVRLARVAVREIDRERAVPVDPKLLTTDPMSVVTDPKVDIVVELVGGISPARELILEAIQRKKPVVTANKLLLATRGEELFPLATEAGVDLYYEAAVCGGVPVIRTLREALASDRVRALYGIVNGTTNFILSRMNAGEAYATALAEAQRLGYAEADPSADVDGDDAAQKICILCTLAFGTPLEPSRVHREGIRNLSPLDLEFARDLGYSVKLLATARAQDGKVDVRVHPAMVPSRSMLAGVVGAFNAVLIECEALGPMMLYGQGAGSMPTGSAVVSDIIEAARGIRMGGAGRVPHLAALMRDNMQAMPFGDLVRRHYLRFTVSDVPGVLARITSALGDRGISISSVMQRARATEPGGAVAVVVTTHAARERDLADAVQWIDALPTTSAPTVRVRIEDEIGG